jgi:hypothetical protein
MEKAILGDEVSDPVPLPTLKPAGQSQQHDPEGREVDHEAELLSRPADGRLKDVGRAVGHYGRMGIRCVRLRCRLRYVQARHYSRHASAGERRRVRVYVPYDRKGERLRIYRVREAMNAMTFETLRVRADGAVLFADIAAR